MPLKRKVDPVIAKVGTKVNDPPPGETITEAI